MSKSQHLVTLPREELEALEEASKYQDRFMHRVEPNYSRLANSFKDRIDILDIDIVNSNIDHADFDYINLKTKDGATRIFRIERISIPDEPRSRDLR